MVDALLTNPDRSAAETDTKERRTLGTDYGAFSAGWAVLTFGFIEPIEEIKVQLGCHNNADAIAVRHNFL